MPHADYPKNYLPAPPVEREKRKTETVRRTSRFGIRRILKSQLYLLTYTIMHTIFSLYIRLRQAKNMISYKIAAVFYYHHRTPALIQRDLRGLEKMPRHLSVILPSDDRGRAGGDLERLINETAEVAAWCACAGIPLVSVYEKSGKTRDALVGNPHLLTLNPRCVEEIHATNPPDHLAEV